MELTYNDLLIDLEKLKNEKNILFSKKILNTKLDLFGLKTKQVLEVAKKYKDIDVSTFELDKYYEVNYLYFYIYLKKNKNIDDQINFLIVNRSHLENWAIVDGTSKLLVDFKLKDSKKFLKFNDEFIVRYPYICMLKFTKNLQNLDEIFSYLKNDDRYYVKMGEGWLLPAEMVELITEGVKNIVCTQPFGCLPNHIAGKGMVRKIREKYPDANIVSIDYDPGASKINQENRIKLMLSTAEE